MKIFRTAFQWCFVTITVALICGGCEKDNADTTGDTGSSVPNPASSSTSANGGSGNSSSTANGGSGNSSSSSANNGSGNYTGSSATTASGTWSANFQGRTIRLTFSNGSGRDSNGYVINGVSGNLWSGKSFSGGRYFIDAEVNGQRGVGIYIPGIDSQGLGYFKDDYLYLGWDDSTYTGSTDGQQGYCGELYFRK